MSYPPIWTPAGDAIYHGCVVLCESKPQPRKRKTPVEVAHNEPPKKKARKSFMKKLPDRDLALPSLTDSTILPPRVLLNVLPSFLDTPNSHLKHSTTEPSEDTVQPPNKSTRAKKVVTSCEDRSTPEAGPTIELKVRRTGKKKRKSETVPVVDSEDVTADADASLVVPHKHERPLPPPYKLKPVIELVTRRSKKSVVQSDEVDFAGDAFGESEDELLILSTNTSGKAKAIYKNPASEINKEGKRKDSKAKLKSRETLAVQATGPGLLAEAPKQLGTSIDGTQCVGATSLVLVPHNLALANSNTLPPLRDTNKPCNEPPSANAPAVVAEPPKSKPKHPSMEHMIPKRRASMTSLLQRAGLHAPLSSSRLTVPATARIAPLHLNRKTPPPPPPHIPKRKKKVESEEETDEEEYVGLSGKQIARLREEKRKRAWYSP